jgi:hypothetical protein
MMETSGMVYIMRTREGVRAHSVCVNNSIPDWGLFCLSIYRLAVLLGREYSMGPLREGCSAFLLSKVSFRDFTASTLQQESDAVHPSSSLLVNYRNT